MRKSDDTTEKVQPAGVQGEDYAPAGRASDGEKFAEWEIKAPRVRGGVTAIRDTHFRLDSTWPQNRQGYSDIKAGIEICLSLNLGKNNRVCVPIVLIIVLP